MLIIANDYQGTGHELSCTKDAKHVQELARNCGVTCYTLYDRQCTRDGVARAIHDVASSCRPHDTFIFYFSGHGTQVTDVDGDEIDQQDEAYVLITESGGIFEADGNPCVLTDDEFVTITTSALHPDVTAIMLSDCCHSGSIADLHKPVWNGRKAISISGCRDAQTSGDIGSGGICTWSMLLAIESLQRKRAMEGKTEPYSIKRLFRELLRQDDGVFESKQDITMDHCKGVSQHDIPWPLIPRSHYSAPPLPAQYHKLAPEPPKAHQAAQPVPQAYPSYHVAPPAQAYPSYHQPTHISDLVSYAAPPQHHYAEPVVSYSAPPVYAAPHQPATVYAAPVLTTQPSAHVLHPYRGAMTPQPPPPFHGAASPMPPMHGQYNPHAEYPFNSEPMMHMVHPGFPGGATPSGPFGPPMIAPSPYNAYRHH